MPNDMARCCNRLGLTIVHAAQNVGPERTRAMADRLTTAPRSDHLVRKAAGTTLNLLLEPTRVATSSADEDGRLVFANGRLVLLADEVHAGRVGSWYLEAGFGPCANEVPPTFATINAALAWVQRQLARGRFHCNGQGQLAVRRIGAN